MTYVPSRKEWSSKLQASGKEITIEHHTVFGWKVGRHIMPVGSQMITRSATEVPRCQAPNRAMYVRGQASVMNSGSALPDRLPGMFTGDRPAHPAGVTTVTAVEETEFWCFNYTANRRALPDLTPVRLASGESLELAAGTKLFVMLGSAGAITGPCTYVPEADQILTVHDDFYAFIVAEARA